MAVVANSGRQGRFRSLSFSLSIVVIFFTLAVLLVSNGIQLYATFHSQRQILADRQRLIAQGAADTVKSFLQSKLNRLQTTAKLTNLMSASPANQKQVLNKLLSLEPAFNNLAILDTTPKVVNNTARLIETGAADDGRTDMPAILAALRQNKTYISQVFIDNSSSEPIVLLASPIKNVYGDLTGVLTAETDLKFMWDLVGSIKIGTGGLAYVVDADGKLIASGDTSRALRAEDLSNIQEVKHFLAKGSRAKTGSFDISRGINNTLVVATYQTLGTPNWAVVTEVPLVEAYSPLIQGGLLFLIIFLLSCLASVIAGIQIARWIARPIMQLRDAARAIGTGKLDTQTSITTHNELGELADSFNAMAHSLQRSTQQLNEAHARLQASIDSLNTGFFMTLGNGSIAFYNPMLTRMLGLPEPKAGVADQDGTTVSLHAIQGTLDDFDLTEAVTACLTTGKPFTKREVSHNERIFSIIGAPVHMDHDRILGCVVLVTDITEQKMLEQSKDDFFSIASHELRTPLTAIKGNSSMMVDYFGDIINKNASLKDIVTDIHDSSARLITIVNDFLDLSRLEQGKMKFTIELFQLETIIESVVYEMKPVLSEKHLYLTFAHTTVDNLPQVWADKNRIKQVIYNLVGNAAKFTDQGGITITTQVQGGFVKVLVTDTGKGISPAAQSLLFKKFEQTGTSRLTRDAARGTGLGLYISKTLVEKMGGKVALEHSEEGKGSTFSFSVPVATETLKKSQVTATADQQIVSDSSKAAVSRDVPKH